MLEEQTRPKSKSAWAVLEEGPEFVVRQISIAKGFGDQIVIDPAGRQYPRAAGP